MNATCTKKKIMNTTWCSLVNLPHSKLYHYYYYYYHMWREKIRLSCCRLNKINK